MFCSPSFLLTRSPAPQNNEFDGIRGESLGQTECNSGICELQPQIQQPNATRDDQQKPPEYTISVETGLVLLDVLVTDEDGNILSGLKKGNFRILDQGKAQT
ncbi:MAG TPA: hypothetical protein VFV92_00200, partial [Candidatus Bathyarchaeia archaeon]|nr:hypothetical protein [Candidatus Bathyarchaeia archaeon]